jgi:hypothetical protein
MLLSTQIMLTGIGAALLILAIGYTRNMVINIISAPLIGVVATVVPAGLTGDDMWLNRAMWIAASIAVYAMLNHVSAAPALDFRRALSGVNRRRTARRAVAAEVKGWRFEVENG